MSLKDLTDYGDVARGFVGKHLMLTVATNSLKLMLNREEPRQGYLWVDPPWTFSQDGVVLADSAGCPVPTQPEYEKAFAEYATLLRPLDGARLVGVTAAQQGSVQFKFEDALVLEVPAESDGEEAMWYEHWYAKGV